MNQSDAITGNSRLPPPPGPGAPSSGGLCRRSRGSSIGRARAFILATCSLLPGAFVTGRRTPPGPTGCPCSADGHTPSVRGAVPQRVYPVFCSVRQALSVSPQGGRRGAGARGWGAGGITLSTCYFTLVHVHQSDTVREIELWGQRAHTSVAELLSAEAASVYTPKRRPVSPRSPAWPLLRLFWSLYVWWVTNVTSVRVRFAFWSPPPP